MVSFHSISIYSPFSDLVLLRISTAKITLKLGHGADEIHLVTDLMHYVVAVGPSFSQQLH